MRLLLAALTLLWLRAPAHADWEAGGCFMGVCAGDVNPEYERLKLEREQDERRAERSKGPGLLERARRTYVAPDQPDLRCIYAAVAAWAGSDVKLEDAPPVYLNSRTLKDDFDVYVHNELDRWPKDFYTVSLPKANVIFIDDLRKNYSAQRTIDDVIAGQYALLHAAKHGLALLPAEAAGVIVSDAERRFHAEYTAQSRSACSR